MHKPCFVCLLYSEEKATELVARIDDNGSLDITFEEWRDYLMFHPSSDIKDVVEYWMDDVYEEDIDNNLVPGPSWQNIFFLAKRECLFLSVRTEVGDSI